MTTLRIAQLMKIDRNSYAPPDPAKIDADNPEALHFWARTRTGV
jgi:hypothetical protein